MTDEQVPHAHFVHHPRNLAGLRKPHLLESEHPYHIEKDIVLPAIDYANLCEDMTVSRGYLEGLVASGQPSFQGDGQGTHHCIRITSKGHRGALLIVPDREGYPLWAAYIAL